MEGENFDFSNNNANGYANNPNGRYNSNSSYNNTNDYNNNNGYGNTQEYDNNNYSYHNAHSYTSSNGYDDSNMNQAPQPGDVLMDMIYTIPDFQFTTSLFDDQNNSVLFSTLPESSSNNTPYIYGEEYHDIFQALDAMAQPSNLGEPSTQINHFAEPSTQNLFEPTINQYFDTQLIPSSESAPSPEERSMYAVSPNNSIMNIEYDVLDSESSSSSSPKPKKRHYCDLCPGNFGRIQDLNRHLTSIHSNKKEFICEHCHKEFSRRDSLKRHQKTERKKKK